MCDHSNESYRAVFSCGTVYHAVQGDSKKLFVDEMLEYAAIPITGIEQLCVVLSITTVQDSSSFYCLNKTPSARCLKCFHLYDHLCDTLYT